MHGHTVFTATLQKRREAEKDNTTIVPSLSLSLKEKVCVEYCVQSPSVIQLVEGFPSLSVRRFLSVAAMCNNITI